MRALKTKVAYSTAFHPQTDGMAEVSNRTLGQLLRLHCKDHRWVKIYLYSHYSTMLRPKAGPEDCRTLLPRAANPACPLIWRFPT